MPLAGWPALQERSQCAAAPFGRAFQRKSIRMPPITEKPITVTADPQTKLLGAPDPALTSKVTSGSLETGDSFSGALTRAPGEAVGSYAITQGSLTAGGNYDVTFVGATLKIVYGWDGEALALGFGFALLILAAGIFGAAASLKERMARV